MKEIKLYILPLIAAILLLGCDDFLDNKPKGYTIPSSYEDYEKMFNYINSTIDGYSCYLTDDVKFLDNTDDYASDYIFINQDDEVKNLYSFQPGQIYLAGSKDYTWNDAYDRIFTYNTIISSIMSSKGSSQGNKLRIKAESLIARAMEYLYLVNLYGAQYNPVTADTDYGVPYLTKGDINQKYTRHTVAQVYEKIIADITEALPNLSDITNFTTHPDKNSGYALLAKTYLCMGNYQKALENANIVLKTRKQLLNLNDYEITEGTTWGRVHIKGDQSQRLPDINHPEALFARFSSGDLRYGTCMSDDLRELFKKDLPEGARDLRKEYYFSEDYVNLGRIEYIPGEVAYVLYVDENCGLTTVETLMIAAECEARIGSKEKAVEYVNLLRDNRIENNEALTANTKEEALKLVLEEKRRELCMKGAFRYMDMKRLNLEEGFKKTVVHKADGSTYTLAPDDLKWIFPINQEILDFNPDMPQYDRK